MGVDVLGLGAVAMDIFLNCRDLPDEDGYTVIQKEFIKPGGSCANVIANLSGLGVKAGFVACLGEDAYGYALKADLEARGVSTRYISFRKNGISMHSYVAVAERGSKVIFCNMGDSLLSLSEADVSARMLDRVKYFYTAMQPGKPALKLARICREKGIPVICNLQVEPQFLDHCGVPSAMVKEMLSLCSLLITFQNGLICYTGQTELHLAAESLYETYRPDMGLIVTLGSSGALWLNRENNITSPAFQIEAKDTTGAGDAFISGIIHAKLVGGFDHVYSMKFAGACAALKCTRSGPRLEASTQDILNFMERYESI